MGPFLIPRRLVNQQQLGTLWAPWKMLESDHDTIDADVSRYLKWIRRLPRGNWTAEQMQEFASMIETLKRRTLGHFKTEEKIVFPYLERCAPSLRPLLRTLVLEHRRFRFLLARLTTCQLRSAQTGAGVSRMRAMGIELLSMLQRHARHEVQIMKQHQKSISL